MKQSDSLLAGVAMCEEGLDVVHPRLSRGGAKFGCGRFLPTGCPSLHHGTVSVFGPSTSFFRVSSCFLNCNFISGFSRYWSPNIKKHNETTKTTPCWSPSRNEPRGPPTNSAPIQRRSRPGSPPKREPSRGAPRRERSAAGEGSGRGSVSEAAGGAFWLRG